MSAPSPGIDKNYGVEADEVSTSQEGPPLTWFCGAARVPATWITLCSDWREMGGKKGQIHATDVLAALACGEVDGVIRVFKDDKEHSYDAYRMPTGNAARWVMVHDNGYSNKEGNVYFANRIRLHWGVDQPQRADRLFPGPDPALFQGDWDPVANSPALPTPAVGLVGRSYRLTADLPSAQEIRNRRISLIPSAGDVIVCQPTAWGPNIGYGSIQYLWHVLSGVAGEIHPDYARVCFVEIDGWPVGGRGRKQLPNLDFVLVRAPRLPSWATGFPTSYIADTAGQGFRLKHGTSVNPVLCLLELLTHPIWGRGMAADEFDLDNWRAVASALDGIDYAIAPKLTRQDDIESVADEILAYFDGYFYRDAQGRLCIGYYAAAGSGVDLGTIPEISEHDLVEVPRIETVTPAETINELTLKYTDARWPEYKLKGRTVTLVAPQNRLQRGSPARETIDRPAITNEWQALKYAEKYLQQKAAQRMSGEIVVRRDRAQRVGGGDLSVGDLFVLDYGPLELDLVCRVVGRRVPMPGAAVTLEWESDRGQFPLPYVAPLASAPDLALPAVEELESSRVRLHYPLRQILEADALRGVCLVARHSRRTLTEGDVWLSTSGTTYTADAIAPVALALRAELVADVVAVAGTVWVDAVGTDVDMLQAQAALEAADDTLLLIIRDEIMSIGGIASVSGQPTHYALTVLRGRQDTVSAAQPRLTGSDPEPVWIVPRADYEAAIFSHADWANAFGATRYLKLRPRNLYQSAALGDAATLAMTCSLPIRSIFAKPVTALDVTIVAREAQLSWTAPAGPSDELVIEYGLSATEGGASVPPTRITIRPQAGQSPSFSWYLPARGWFWFRMWSRRGLFWSDPTSIIWRECKVPNAPSIVAALQGPITDPAVLVVLESLIAWSWAGSTASDTVLLEWRPAGADEWQSMIYRHDAAARLHLPHAGDWEFRASGIDRNGQRSLPSSISTLTMTLPQIAGVAGAWSNGTARLSWTAPVSLAPGLSVGIETDYGTGTNYYSLGSAAPSGSSSAGQPSGVTWKYRMRLVDARGDAGAWSALVTVAS